MVFLSLFLENLREKPRLVFYLTLELYLSFVWLLRTAYV